MDNSSASESHETHEISESQHKLGVAAAATTTVGENEIQYWQSTTFNGVAGPPPPPPPPPIVLIVQPPNWQGFVAQSPLPVPVPPPQITDQDYANEYWKEVGASISTAIQANFVHPQHSSPQYWQGEPIVSNQPPIIGHQNWPGEVGDQDSNTDENAVGRASTSTANIGTKFVPYKYPGRDDVENQTSSEGNNSSRRKSYCSDDRRKLMMYRAAIEGDWAAAGSLLKEDMSLASQHIKGHTPLHLAVALKHDKFAQKLLEWLGPDDLLFTDSFGVTACCYATLTGMSDIAESMIEINPKIASVRNAAHAIPLHTALHCRSKLFPFLLQHTGLECLSKEEWLLLLQSAIESKMNDMALKILSKDDSLAIMANKDIGTALHALAQQNISEATTGNMSILLESIFGLKFKGRQNRGEMPRDMSLLAKKLLSKMQESMEESDALEYLSHPPILHHAAREGNVELIIMLARAYPDLVFLNNDQGLNLFDIAVKNRQDNVFGLIHEIGGLKLMAMSGTDAKGNTILHFAAELGPLDTNKDVVSIPALQMQRELVWFKEVEALVSRWVSKSKNEDGKTPRELFSKQHDALLKESEKWMNRTADSCMLIATIILTVVYAAAFTVPGGNNQQTGLPTLVSNGWFTCFIIFEALAMLGSTLCVITFWSIKSSSFGEDQFLHILPFQLKLGLTGLFGSLIGAVSAFMSAYFLVLVQGRAWHVKSIVVFVYVILVLAIFSRFSELWFKMKLPKSFRRVLAIGNSQGLFSAAKI